MTKLSRKDKADALGIRRYCKGRAAKVESIIKEFYDGHDLQASAGDLIADIMHLCDRREALDFDKAIDSASYHFNAEREGGEHG